MAANSNDPPHFMPGDWRRIRPPLLNCRCKLVRLVTPEEVEELLATVFADEPDSGGTE